MTEQACQRDGCVREGRWVPLLCVPRYGAPDSEAMGIVVGLVLCADHLAEMKPADLLVGPDGGRGLRPFFEAICGMVGPDFERARIERRGLDSPEYIRLQSVRMGEAQGRA